jgi:hypothetical protein
MKLQLNTIETLYRVSSLNGHKISKNGVIKLLRDGT